MSKYHSINLNNLHFLGYSVGIYTNTLIIRVPQYGNLNKFIQDNVSYNHTSINTFVLVESDNYFFIGVINKEDMSEPDKKELINNNNKNNTETPELYITILSEINPINCHLIRHNQHFPVIHSKVYVANKALINNFINESSNDINVPKYAKKINRKNSKLKIIESIVKTNNFSKLVQDPDINVNLSFNTLFGRHLGIVGSTGSGKSYTAAKLIWNLAENNSRHRYPVILLDPTGEYNTLVNSIKNDGKSVVKFDIGVDTRIPYYDLNDNELYKLVKPSPGIQFPKLRNAIKDLKYIGSGNYINSYIDWANDSNINGIKDIKIMRDCINNTIYSNSYDKKLGYDFSKLPLQIQAECYRYGSSIYQSVRDYGYCASLTDRINSLEQNVYISKYFCNSPYNKIIINGCDTNIKSINFQSNLCYDNLKNYNITYINLSHITLDESIAEIIGDYIARKLLESFIRNTNEHGAPKHPAVLFLDEAHNFIKKDNVNDDYHLHYFDLIAKEGRKYGLLMTLITQSPNDLSRDVLTQFGTFIIHHLGNDIERQKVASALPYNSNLDQYMSSLNTGEAIISSNNMYNPLLVNINKIKDPKYRPKSNTPRF